MIDQIREEYKVERSDPDWEEKEAKHRDKIFGNIRFIGALYIIDILSTELILNILFTYLITPWVTHIKESEEPLNEQQLTLVEGCCVICESIGIKMEPYIDALR